MTPTLCARCGGMDGRCECADLRREGMLLAATIILRFAAELDQQGDNPAAMVVWAFGARALEEGADAVRELAMSRELPA